MELNCLKYSGNEHCIFKWMVRIITTNNELEKTQVGECCGKLDKTLPSKKGPKRAHVTYKKKTKDN